MFLAYIDDSKDSNSACFSALVVPARCWLQVDRRIRNFRRALNVSDGIRVRKELHATDFVAGRGDLGCFVSRWRRARIFEEALRFVANLPDVHVLNACVPRKHEDRAFERLVGRLNVFAGKARSHVMLISDEGKDYTALVRRMRRRNYVGRAGRFNGSVMINKPLERVVEDIVYRDSKHSAFIQLADFVAFSLLRFESPTPRLAAVGLDKAFLILYPVVVKQAFRRDPKGLGIIRET